MPLLSPIYLSSIIYIILLICYQSLLWHLSCYLPNDVIFFNESSYVNIYNFSIILSNFLPATFYPRNPGIARCASCGCITNFRKTGKERVVSPTATVKAPLGMAKDEKGVVTGATQDDEAACG